MKSKNRFMLSAVETLFKVIKAYIYENSVIA